MLRQIKMFRLDQVSLDEVNTFLQELDTSGATDIDVQVAPISEPQGAVVELTATSPPNVAVFVVYTPKVETTRKNIGLGPYD